MRKATARKDGKGYRAVVIREDGSSFSASRKFATRPEAIAAAQLWIESNDANANRPRPQKINPMTMKRA